MTFLTGGNIFHGAMGLDSLFLMRPVKGWWWFLKLTFFNIATFRLFFYMTMFSLETALSGLNVIYGTVEYTSTGQVTGPRYVGYICAEVGPILEVGWWVLPVVMLHLRFFKISRKYSQFHQRDGSCCAACCAFIITRRYNGDQILYSALLW